MNYSLVISVYVRNTVIYFVESTQPVFQVLFVGGVDVCMYIMWVHVYMLLFSHSAVSDSSWPCGLQHIRLPCPSLSPGVCSDSCSLSRWCSVTISSSAVLFCSCPQSFPISELALHIRWPKYWSFSFSISPSSEYLGLISFRMDWLDLLSLKSLFLLSRVFSSTTIGKHQFFGAQPSLWSTLTSVYDHWGNYSFDYMNLCWQSDVSVFNMLSSLSSTINSVYNSNM